MKAPNNKTKAKVLELEEKVEVLGNVVTNLYKEVEAYRTVVGILDTAGILKEAAAKIEAEKEPSFDPDIKVE